MPSCFALHSKEFPKSGPVLLSGVDDLMREHFGAPADKKQWYRNWYDTIGLCLAIGHPLQKCKEFFPEKADIIDWLDANYTTDSWKEWK